MSFYPVTISRVTRTEYDNSDGRVRHRPGAGGWPVPICSHPSTRPARTPSAPAATAPQSSSPDLRPSAQGRGGVGGRESESCRRIGFLAPRCWWPVPGPSVLLTRPRPLGPGNLFFSPPRHRLCDCRIYYLNSILLNSHLIPRPFQPAECVH